MKKIIPIFIVLLFLFSSAVFAQDNEDNSKKDKIKELCNKVMLNIFDYIMDSKPKYRELKEFDSSVLTQKTDGIYLIQYKFKDSAARKGGSQFYEFAVTINNLEDENAFALKSQTFDFGFPLLDVKISGYQIKSLRTKQFDLGSPIEQYGKILWAAQEDFLPFQLTLKPSKESFNVGEQVVFIVTLKNVTKSNIKVKDLNSNTLIFLYDNEEWGSKKFKSKEDQDELVLLAGRSISKEFSVPARRYPGKFKIYATYIKTYKGVSPSNAVTVDIVKGE